MWLSVVPAVTMIAMLVMIVGIAVSIMIRVVIVLNTAAVSFPIPRIETFAVVVRCNPVRPLVRWPSPIAFMPLVVFSYWIPVTFHPYTFRSWPCGYDHGHSGRRWRPNYDSHRNLCVVCRSRD
jgi:hypothetical protein